MACGEIGNLSVWSVLHERVIGSREVDDGSLEIGVCEDVRY